MLYTHPTSAGARSAVTIRYACLACRRLLHWIIQRIINNLEVRLHFTPEIELISILDSITREYSSTRGISTVTHRQSLNIVNDYAGPLRDILKLKSPTNGNLPMY